jgi:hypothetical protein
MMTISHKRIAWRGKIKREAPSVVAQLKLPKSTRQPQGADKSYIIHKVKSVVPAKHPPAQLYRERKIY